MSELHLYPVQKRECWTHTNMISVMREIENYVLNSSIALTSAYDKLVEKLRAELLAWQHVKPQLIQVYQPQIVSQGESPKSPSDSAKEWDDAQTILPGTVGAGTFECVTHPTESVAEPCQGVQVVSNT